MLTDADVCSPLQACILDLLFLVLSAQQEKYSSEQVGALAHTSAYVSIRMQSAYV
jgi:hypothetical protein